MRKSDDMSIVTDTSAANGVGICPDGIEAFIFDLDGVIVHTDKFHYLAWKEIADSMGIYFDETINNRLRGVSRMESLEIVLERYSSKLSDDEKTALAQEKNAVYRSHLSTMIPADVPDEVRDTLKGIREKGYKLAIGSSSKNARFILEKVGLLNFFDAISDGNNITKSKPDPEVFIKAAEYLNICPEHCIVVEDAYAGVIAAKAAGMLAAAIGDAVSCEKSDFRLNSLPDLLNI